MIISSPRRAASCLGAALFTVPFLLFGAPAGAQGVLRPAPAPPPPPADAGWPRVVPSGADTLTVYQPQLDSWDGNHLQARMAIAVLPQGALDPVFGVAIFTARTDVDKAERVVYLEEMTITTVRFPTARNSEAEYRKALQAKVPARSRAIALDRLEADLQIAGAAIKAGTLPLENAPPKILFSDVPAVLISIDGEPTWRPVKGTSLQRVINTAPVLVRTAAKKGTIYLHLFDGWLQATSLAGPWTVTTSAPPATVNQLNLVLRTLVDSGEADPLVGAPSDPFTKSPTPSLLNPPVPKVVLANSATELIVTEGAPKWAAIDGTPLLFIKNTSGRVLQDTTDHKLYLLLAGRWFIADSLAGPWQHVHAKDLPKAFSQIPDSSAMENVKAAVPGTPQAAEALIENEIPQTKTLARSETKMAPLIVDGAPQLRPIEGTTMQYVANASRPVILVTGGGWYACENGVWFTAEALEGPWKAAAVVPAEIYTIPPAAPLHYVTYVRVYSATADSVYLGYTPGYTGTVINEEDLVVYGTGYTYTPWIGEDWYAAPYTYGYGANIGWTPWYGWRYGAGYGYAWGWGGYGVGSYRGVGRWGVADWGVTSGNVYSQWGPRVAVARNAAGYDPVTGNAWADRASVSYNSRTGIAAAGQRGAIGNAYTGEWATGARGGFYDTRTGNYVTYSGARGPDGGYVRVGNTVFADRDGNVYRYNGDAGWRGYGARGWGNVDAGRTAEMNRWGTSRGVGEQRYNGFRNAGGARARGGRR